MRVLLVRPGPHFSVEDVASGWAKGLEQNGCEVADFNLQDRLGFYASHPKVDNALEGVILATKGIQAACYEFQPDVVLIVSGFYIPPSIYQLIRARGSKVVLLHTESPYEDDKQSVRALHADLNVVNDPTNLDQFPDGSLYLPHCYDPDLHHPSPSTADAVSDFCFVGTGYPSRVAFLEAVDWSGIDVALAGHWSHTPEGSPLRKFMAHDIDECCENSEAAVLYASTKASANLYRKEATHNADGWAMGPREVELAACGTFFLREARGESDEVLSMLPTFTDPADFGSKLRWWLAHDDARSEAAAAARDAVADRTFDKSAARLLEALGV
jgi:spore maturation protein CgeB